MKRLDPATRLFDVECVCGGEFRVTLEIDTAGRKPRPGFLATPAGRCPHCGLRLEQIDPFGISKQND
jgi:hypothetical protein